MKQKLSDFSRNPLLLYALQYWMRHLKRAFDLQGLSQRNNDDVITLIEDFTRLWNHAKPKFR